MPSSHNNDEKPADPFLPGSQAPFGIKHLEGVPEEPPASLTAGLTTTHDAVLADLRGTDSTAPPRTQGDHASSDRTRRASRPEILRNPFDGSIIGALDVNAHSSSHSHMPPNAEGKTEELWSHLSRVLELQSQIANLHVNMEGVGSKTADYGKGKMKTKGSLAQSTKSWQTPKVGLASGPEEDEGVDVKAEEDEEEVKNREREEEFAQLADQFEGRKESINEIMAKLGDLSSALTEFHALQAPKIEFPASSRQVSQAMSPKSSTPTYSPVPRSPLRGSDAVSPERSTAI